MPSTRGPHPEDTDQFTPETLPRLRAAVRDLSWLRSRGYGGNSPLELVGDRYRLKRRQRNAVARSACSDAERRHRLDARVVPSALAGCRLEIDGFNVLITVEAAFGGAYLFVGRDSAYRDVDPVRGTYRIVEETELALTALRQTLDALDVQGVTWHLDQGVSNVGRLKARLEEQAPGDFSWTVQVEQEVDALLKTTTDPVVTSDSDILQASAAWAHLEALVHARHVPGANVRDLRPDGERSPVPGTKEEADSSTVLISDP